MRAWCFALFLAGACASGQPAGGGGGADAGGPGGGGADASPTAAGPAAREVVGGSGRMSGGSFTLDVQIGHPVDQAPAVEAGERRLEGGAVVKP